MRLIDTDKLNIHDVSPAYGMTVMGVTEEDIDLAETVDAVPVKHGHWVDMGDFEQCSCCNGTRLKEMPTYYGKAIWIKTKYCGACGAKMDEESMYESNG